MPSIRDVAVERVALEVPFGDLVVSVVYAGQRFTSSEYLWLRSGRFEDDADTLARMVRLLSRTVLAWDLTDENGPIPLTEKDVFERVPVDIVYALMSAIAEDMEERGKAPATNSTSPLPPTERRVKSRGGTP